MFLRILPFGNVLYFRVVCGLAVIAIVLLYDVENILNRFKPSIVLRHVPPDLEDPGLQNVGLRIKMSVGLNHVVCHVN